ncbi:MAG: hypothetical protein JNK17_00260 [Hydrogenophaga sp.]|nr:hypothetical protein [Hydrogenophaga sp.]
MKAEMLRTKSTSRPSVVAGIIVACIAASGCESSEEKELKRLQLEKARLEVQLQTQKLNQDKERSEQEERQRKEKAIQEEQQRRERTEQEERAKIALMKAEAERIEREKAQQIAAQQEEERRHRADQADKFVRARAEYRLPQIVRPLMGTDPTISVTSHNCSESGGSFTATTKIGYKGQFSGDSFMVSGKLTRRPNGEEYFQFDPVSAEIIGRLALIAQGDQELLEKLRLLAAGKVYLEWKSN